MEAIVLAGGLGTRLRSVVADLPKPLAPVAGRPFLCLLLDQLDQQGASTCVLSVGYMHEKIRAVIGDRHGRIRIKYSVEHAPLGTGGAIWQGLESCSNDNVLVLNGDSYIDTDFQAMLARQEETGASVTMCVTEVPDAFRYGTVRIESGHVVGFIEKGTTGRAHINAGVYCVQKMLKSKYPMPERFSFEADLLAGQVSTLRPVAHVVDGLFIDIGIPDDYARAQDLFRSQGA